jgi:hypothetical protein
VTLYQGINAVPYSHITLHTLLSEVNYRYPKGIAASRVNAFANANGSS